jgi:predicted dienelactone hydrolase
LTAVRRCFVALLLVVAVAACADSGTKQAAPSSSSSTAPTRPFHVTHRDIALEDTSRGRKLPTLLLVPDGSGPFPLVEFSHGVTSSGPAYLGFLEPIAAAGYVVAAPTFPLTSGPGGWTNLADYANQPADVYFVVDSVLKLSVNPNDALYGKVDADELALSGHSLGAMTTIGAAYNSCCAQPRVKAAISISGVESTFGDGTFDNRPPVPLLLGHGEKDTTIVSSGSDTLFQRATGPTAYVRYPDATHTSIFAGDNGKLLDQATIAWLDKWLRNDSTGFDALPGAVTASGIATLQTKNL